MSLVLIIFIALYLLPVIPVARRKAWFIENNRKVIYVIPERKVTQVSGKYVYINENITNTEEPNNQSCQNCGAEIAFHKGGRYQRIGGRRAYTQEGYESPYISCRNFQAWDGVKSFWPSQDVLAERKPASSIPIALLLGVFWPTGLIKTGYRVVEPNWSGFAKPPAAVAKDIRLKSLEKKNEELERELKIGPFKEEE
jgi:hypothetical protein